uniref:CARD domain-containing protein n=1 Tax=Plectus sambesii TaxID=2011161 RepID=A0A914VLU6_9BILA
MDKQKRKAIEVHNAALVEGMVPMAVIDQLRADLISQAERETIEEAHAERRAKNRQLISVLFRTREELKPFEGFVHALKNTDSKHEIMANKILQSYKQDSGTTWVEQVSEASRSDAGEAKQGLQKSDSADFVQTVAAPQTAQSGGIFYNVQAHQFHVTQSTPDIQSGHKATVGLTAHDSAMSMPQRNRGNEAALSLAPVPRNMAEVNYIVEEDVETVIRESRPYTCKNLDLTKILTSLEHKKFLDRNQIDEIEAEKTPFKRITQLLNTFPKLNHGALECYLEALHTSNQHKILEHIWFSCDLPEPLKRMCIEAVFLKHFNELPEGLRNRCLTFLGR